MIKTDQSLSQKQEATMQHKANCLHALEYLWGHAKAQEHHNILIWKQKMKHLLPITLSPSDTGFTGKLEWQTWCKVDAIPLAPIIVQVKLLWEGATDAALPIPGLPRSLVFTRAVPKTTRG